MRRTTLVFSDLVTSAIPPRLVAPVLLAYENPLRPVEPAQEPASSPVTASAATDSHTLMLPTFEDDLERSGEESPTHSSGVTFEDGISGAGVLSDGSDLLTYSSTGTFTAGAGIVEFRIKPRRNGSDHVAHFFFTLGDAFWLVKDGAAATLAPAPAAGNHVAEVRVFVTYYASQDGPKGQSLFDPLGTVLTKNRPGLATVEGADYQSVDSGLRMLRPHELLRAQLGRFADTYDLSAATTKSAQVRLIGNPVWPAVGEAMVSANTTIAQGRVA